MGVLRDELAQDPEGVGYATMSAVEVEAAINVQRFDAVGLLPIGTMVSVLYNSGTFDGILAASLGGNVQATMALEKVKLLVALGIQSIDCSHAKALADLTAAGVPQSDIDAIKALATAKKSRAEILGLPYVNATMVTEARA
jgi:hypothetical protein